MLVSIVFCVVVRLAHLEQSAKSKYMFFLVLFCPLRVCHFVCARVSAKNPSANPTRNPSSLRCWTHGDDVFAFAQHKIQPRIRLAIQRKTPVVCNQGARNREPTHYCCCHVCTARNPTKNPTGLPTKLPSLFLLDLRVKRMRPLCCLARNPTANPTQNPTKNPTRNPTMNPSLCCCLCARSH